MIVEIACCNLQSCINAQHAGASRIELFENLTEGGCTPSYGMIRKVKKEVDIPVYVMIRPRGGDFVYSDDEIEIMKEDIAMCKQLGVDGVVFGILTPYGDVAVEHCADLLQLWGSNKATFHRAFDRAMNLDHALEDIINLGFERVLTSGGQKDVFDGKDRIKSLQQKFGRQINIMPGAGVTPENARAIAEYCQTNEIHATCKAGITSNVNSNPIFNDGFTISELNCIQNLVSAFDD